MTTQIDERHYCRNPKCRSKLAAPVSNPREAFCARGCHTSFYRHRCIACEKPMERKTESRQLCGRPKCNSQFRALKAGFLLGRYHSSSPASNASRNPINTGTFSSLITDRGWRHVAGPKVDLRLATIAGADAVKQANRTNRKFWSDAGPRQRSRAITRRSTSSAGIGSAMHRQSILESHLGGEHETAT
jgi:hypothetical protein